MLKYAPRIIYYTKLRFAAVKNVVIIALGGALGTLLRYFVSGVIQKIPVGIFPVGTLAVNLTGSLLIGILWGLFEDLAVSYSVRSFLLIGMLGAYTTFSTFVFETFNLLRDGEIKMAVANILLSNVIGLLLVFGGYFASKSFVAFFK